MFLLINDPDTANRKRMDGELDHVASAFIRGIFHSVFGRRRGLELMVAPPGRVEPCRYEPAPIQKAPSVAVGPHR
jgi:hypothetical protein